MAAEERVTARERAELEALRARVAELEQRLADAELDRASHVAAAMDAAAAAQERAYWLDRWHVDLNALVATRTGAALRLAARTLRAPVRAARRAARRRG